MNAQQKLNALVDKLDFWTFNLTENRAHKEQNGDDTASIDTQLQLIDDVRYLIFEED